VLLLTSLLVLFFQLRKNRKRSYFTKDKLPPIKRSARNHLMMLDSNEEFILFLGISNSGFKLLLDTFDSVSRRRRKRFFLSADALELTLHWMNLTMRQKHKAMFPSLSILGLLVCINVS